MKIKRVRIEGNGQQAPYGIGEIIDIIPASHWRKIERICGKYYNSPTLRDDEVPGMRMEFETEGGKVVGVKPSDLTDAEMYAEIYRNEK